MSDIVFQPYIGPNYRGSSTRLLVVGESHHGFPEEHSDTTQRVMDVWRERGPGAGKLRYLTRLGRVIAGKEAWELDRPNTFNAIAWYNYVQASMNDSEVTDFTQNPEGSARAFREVLAELNPTHIIVTGLTKLWDVLPPSDGIWEDREFSGKSLNVCQYRTPDGFALVAAIAHASRISPPVWQGPVKDFLAS